MVDYKPARREGPVPTPARDTQIAPTRAGGGGGARDALRTQVRGSSYEEGQRRLSPRDEGENRASAPAGPGFQAYTIVRGDSLSAIARRFNVPGGYPALARHNGISDPNRILVGQILQVPIPEVAPASLPSSTPEATSGPAPSPTAAPAVTAAPSSQTLPAEDPVERQEFENFQAAEHLARNQSLGGSGNFDLRYTPATGVARVEVRVAFEFVAGTVGDMLSSLFGSGPSLNEYLWTEEARASFQQGFIDQVHQVWSGQHRMHCTRPASTLNYSPSWTDLVADADVIVVADPGNPHFTVRVQRIPVGQFETSSVTAPSRDGEGHVHGAGLAELDSNDLTGVQKASASAGTTQRAGVHEFGHMLGLQDEYQGRGRPEGSTTRQGSSVGNGNNDDRIMAGGEIVQQAHYASIRAALNTAAAPVPFDFV